MAVYISGIGNISPQDTTDNGYMPDTYHEYVQEFINCIEPNYRDYIDAMARRRMGKVIRMSIVSAVMALKDAGISKPDAIITGTGHGSIEGTENFLMNMLRHNESLLNPTPFIQATYNSVSTQIAIHLNCQSYNSTYVHRGLSFESALLDAILLLNENPAQNILAGGTDEITPNHYIINKRNGSLKQEQISNKQLLSSKTKGSLAGEGAVFFVLSGEKLPDTYAQLTDIVTIYKELDITELTKKITDFLSKHKLHPADIDLFLTGISGDHEKDKVYVQTADELFPSKTLAYYKHLCGEYFTSSAFGLWLAAKMIKNQHVPSSVIVRGDKPYSLKKILFYNRYNNREHSLMLVSVVE